MLSQGLSQAAPLRQSRTAIGIVPLKNGQGDNLSPSKFREKTRKEAHTKRFISVQKLQAETECGSIFYRTFKVYSKVLLRFSQALLLFADSSRGRGAAKFTKHEKYHEIR